MLNNTSHFLLLYYIPLAVAGAACFFIALVLIRKHVQNVSLIVATSFTLIANALSYLIGVVISLSPFLLGNLSVNLTQVLVYFPTTLIIGFIIGNMAQKYMSTRAAGAQS